MIFYSQSRSTYPDCLGVVWLLRLGRGRVKENDVVSVELMDETPTAYHVSRLMST